MARLDGVANVKVSFTDKHALVSMKPGAVLERSVVEKAINVLNDEDGNSFRVVAFEQQ